MKALKFFLLIFFISAASNSYAQDWSLQSSDLRRAVANNSNPPERLEPSTKLKPLNTNEGIIRRVKLFSDDIKAIALTFDLCELDTVTTGCDMDVINFLRLNKIPATLFMGGKWMRTHSERVKMIMTEKIFEIANHNWSHGNCALLSDEGLTAQILWTQAQYELLRDELNDSNKKNIPDVPVLFRLPYGRSSERALKIINGLGLRVIQWDVAAEDGDNSNNAHAKKLAKKILSMTRPGSILLFHANLVPKGTANLLRECVKLFNEQNYKFVTVSELLTMGEPETTRDGYFTVKGDNKALDEKFGADGTGRKTKFTGK